MDSTFQNRELFLTTDKVMHEAEKAGLSTLHVAGTPFSSLD